MPEGAGHDHRIAAQHNYTSNVSLVSHLALVEQEGETAQSHAIDICDRWAAVGREFAGTDGVDIVDIADPGHPVWVGKYRDSKAVGGDRNVAWSADCRFVFMANEGPTIESSGVRVIRAQDKAHPTFESLYRVTPPTPLPTDCISASGTTVACSVSGGVHTVYALQAGGVQYVYALNYGVHILRLDETRTPATLLPVGRFVDADAQAQMEVNRNGYDPAATRRTILGHDMTVYQEGAKVILYVAYAYAGLDILDITNPTAPVLLGKWVPGGEGAPHYVHGVEAYTARDGRRLAVVEAETFEERNTQTPSPIWVVDVTDPKNVRLLSTWVNPGRHGADHLLFSSHFFDLDGDTLWLTHYHGGVWALDISDPTRPRVAGYYMPHEDTGYEPSVNCCIGWKLGGIPMTFDVMVKDHVAYAADFSTGFYALRLAST